MVLGLDFLLFYIFSRVAFYLPWTAATPHHHFWLHCRVADVVHQDARGRTPIGKQDLKPTVSNMVK